MPKPISGFWDDAEMESCANKEESGGGEYCVQCNQCGKLDKGLTEDERWEIQQLFESNIYGE